MEIDRIREYCLSKEGAEETLPFDNETPVYKVNGKMFLLLNLTPPYSINIKCDPEYAIELRERYDDVIPGYHMNKKHWNTVYLKTNIPSGEIFSWIDDSYNLVSKSKKKKA